MRDLKLYFITKVQTNIETNKSCNKKDKFYNDYYIQKQ